MKDLKPFRKAVDWSLPSVSEAVWYILPFSLALRRLGGSDGISEGFALVLWLCVENFCVAYIET